MLAAAVAFGVFGGAALAQDMPPALAPPAPAPKAAEPAQPVVIPAAQGLTDAQFDRLVAPIALYPDALLGQVLMASTYPLQVVEAAHWLGVPANRALAGDGLTAALKSKRWDPSVMALVPFPGLLAIMADKLEWTEQLSTAFLNHEAEVMAAVQRLRHRAMAAGNLKATPECHCVIQVSGDHDRAAAGRGRGVRVPASRSTARRSHMEPGRPRTLRRPRFRRHPVSSFRRGSSSGSTRRSGRALRPALGLGLDRLAASPHCRRQCPLHAVVPGHPGFPGGVWTHAAPHRFAAAAEPPVVLRPHPAKPRRLALAHPPASFTMPRHHGTGIPPGTIVPAPPPVHHAHYMPGPYFDRYR